MKGSCRVKASAALQEGWESSFSSLLRISGYYVALRFMFCRRSESKSDQRSPLFVFT